MVSNVFPMFPSERFPMLSHAFPRSAKEEVAHLLTASHWAMVQTVDSTIEALRRQLAEAEHANSSKELERLEQQLEAVKAKCEAAVSAPATLSSKACDVVCVVESSLLLSVILLVCCCSVKLYVI